MQHINIIDFLLIAGIYVIGLLIYVFIKTIIETKNNKNKPTKF
jgi:hypothetical protein